MKTYKTWKDAYNHQQNSVYHDGEIYGKLHLEIEVEELDSVQIAPPQYESVWMAVSKSTIDNGYANEDDYGDGSVIQYGVTKDRKFCRLVAEHVIDDWEIKNYETFETFEEMLGSDAEAIVIFNNMPTVTTVYPFLLTGEIGDEEDEFTDGLEDDLDFLDADLPFEDEDDDLDSDCLSDCDCEDDYCYYEDEEDDFEDLDLDDSDVLEQYYIDNEPEGLECESEIKENTNEEEHVFKIEFSIKANGEREKMIVEGESNADREYDGLVKSGFGYVEKSRLLDIHVSYR